MRENSKTKSLQLGQYPMVRRSERFRVTVMSGSQSGQAIEGGADPVRIGAADGNTLRVENETVSRHHFEIEETQLGHRLRDLGSTNGTFVDGYRVVEMYLPKRANVRAGEIQFTFETLGEQVDVALSAKNQFGDALGSSPAMRELFNLLEKVAQRDLTILLEGESGTGKERLAEAIHQCSVRAQKKFVVFDCASVPASLMESELLGHERGAFTGAQTRRVGRFEEAQGGTLFLDEVGELPIELQPKLLRALEQREIRRVGGTEVIPVDVRVVAATNRDLMREMSRGAFREDLYYRLAVVRVRVPPLHERKEDLPLLVEHFVREAFDGDEAQTRDVLARVTDEDWHWMHAQPWPGNVRELRNFVERTLALSGGISAQASSPLSPQTNATARPAATGNDPEANTAAPSQVAAPIDLIDLARPFLEAREELLARFERGYLEAMLDAHGGNISRAARAAGLDRMHFKRLLARRQD